jgi:hypothetical protein
VAAGQRAVVCHTGDKAAFPLRGVSHRPPSGTRGRLLLKAVGAPSGSVAIHARAPGGGSSGCSCGEFVAVHLRPQLSRISVNLLLRGLLWTSADVCERDHDGLAVWESGVRVTSAPLVLVVFHKVPRWARRPAGCAGAERLAPGRRAEQRTQEVVRPRAAEVGRLPATLLRIARRASGGVATPERRDDRR